MRNRHSHVWLSLFSCLLLVAGSATTLAEKKSETIVGSIDAATGRYTAFDKSFTVTLPVRGTPAYVTQTITDAVTTRGNLISVEPKRGAGSYRLETSFAVATSERTSSFADATAKTFDWYRRLAERAYRRPMIELFFNPFEINGRPAISAIYKQLSSPTSGPRYHLFYLVDFNDKLAFVWTDIPLDKEDLNTEDMIITGNVLQAKNSVAMLRSLQFN